MDNFSDRNSAELLRSIKGNVTEYDSLSVKGGKGGKSGKERVESDKNGSNESIALRLLKSPDSRIAAAAKRIFASSEIKPASNSSDAGQNAPNKSASAHDANDIHKSHIILGILATTATGLDTQKGINEASEEGTFLDADKKLIASLQGQIDHRNGANYNSNSDFAVAPFVSERQLPVAKQIDVRNTLKQSPRSVNIISKDRLHRRERNRMHARKTRQRKKEHMQHLQDEAKSLKNEQIRLKLQINEKNTANILLVMCNNHFATDQNQHSSVRGNPPDPQVEKLMQRDTKDIPDSSRVMELPALVLPGQHKKKVTSLLSHTNTHASAQALTLTSANTQTNGSESLSLNEHKLSLQNYNEELMEGIDYNLLCRDRSTCTPTELNLIRKERNRMHAKRTRDRKRIFMEEMKLIIEQLKNENKVLKDYMNSLNSMKSANMPPLGLSSPTTPDSSMTPSQMGLIPPMSLDSQPARSNNGMDLEAKMSCSTTKT